MDSSTDCSREVHALQLYECTTVAFKPMSVKFVDPTESEPDLSTLWKTEDTDVYCAHPEPGGTYAFFCLCVDDSDGEVPPIRTNDGKRGLALAVGRSSSFSKLHWRWATDADASDKVKWTETVNMLPWPAWVRTLRERL